MKTYKGFGFSISRYGNSFYTAYCFLIHEHFYSMHGYEAESQAIEAAKEYINLHSQGYDAIIQAVSEQKVLL